MSPALVFDSERRLVAITGSPGGGRIIGYVAQSLVALLDWNMEPAVAASLPHIGPLNATVELEEGTAVARLAPVLQERGLPVATTSMPSGLNLIRVQPGAITGAADPRREGAVAGD
jgi:gamma-glutamyltranspeptidase/glutathione hydrolase